MSKSIKVGNGEVINIGRGKNISINSVANIIGKSFKYMPSVKEPFANLASLERAKTLLNWEPKIELEDWLKNYLSSEDL